MVTLLADTVAYAQAKELGDIPEWLEHAEGSSEQQDARLKP